MKENTQTIKLPKIAVRRRAKRRFYLGATTFMLIAILFFFIGYSVKGNFNNNVMTNDQGAYSKNEETPVTAQTIRISPGAEFIFIANYTRSDKAVSEILTAPERCVGLTKEEIVLLYPQWRIDTFSVKKAVFSREIDAYAPDTYLLTISEIGGAERLCLFVFDENGDKVLKESYETPPEMFADEEFNKLKSGIIIANESELERILQNYTE